MFQMNVVHGDGLEFNTLIYPSQHPNTINYIQQSLSNLPSQLLDTSRDLYEIANQKFQQLNSSEARQRVFNVLSTLGNIRNENIIYPIKDIEECRSASITMQRWIMSEPNIRTLYHNQQCDGYSDTYVDMEPNKISEDHYDWRRAMSGVVQYESDDIVAKFYMEELRDGDRELSPFEQLMIQRSWETVKIAVSQMNDDPTNPFGGKL